MDPERLDQRRALLVTGTVGTGKTSVAAAAGSLLARERIPHAVIDLDALSQSWPPPAGDPFNRAMELRNLHAVAGNYLFTGHRLVLSGVVESRSGRRRYRAVVGANLCVCRLRADLAEVRRRLRIRHADAEADMAWHFNRAGELDRILNASQVEDFEVRSDRGTVTDVAAAVLTRAGWL